MQEIEKITINGVTFGIKDPVSRQASLTEGYETYGLPVLAFTGDVSAMTKDNAVTLNYEYGDRSGTCTMKWQGSSSLAYPKKNYTVKFDNAFEAAEGWGEQKKYCLKANYIDHSHARNVVSGKLWGQIVKTRTPANARLNQLPNGGAIDGFPCVITINGKYEGLYTFNIPKDGWMFGMGKNIGAGEAETLTPANITYDGVDPVTFAYTESASKSAPAIRRPGSLTGGTLNIDFDVTKIKGFYCTIYLVDSDGNAYKWLPTYGADGSVLDHANGGASGHYANPQWQNPGEGSSGFSVAAPCSFAIPDGYTPLIRIDVALATFPDGTVTAQWSGTAEANGTWAYIWQANGIVATVTPTAGETSAAVVCAKANNTKTAFFAEATLSNDFEIEYVTDEDNADWVLTSLNRLINACINSDGTDLDTTIAQYLDWESAIDYYIYAVLLGGQDIMYKNYLLATYGGTKWFFSAYDMDSTFGLYWNGRSFTSATEFPLFNEFYHRVMHLIREYKKDALKERYAQLRAGAMSENNVITQFTNFTAKIPSRAFLSDVEVWPAVPSSAASNLAQIATYYPIRAAIMDKQIEAL